MKQKPNYFKWVKKNERLKRTYPCNYISKKEIIFEPYRKLFLKARICSRINGFNTAFAEISWSVEWPTINHQKWGFDIHRHFNGKYSFIKAKSWCNFFLNNPPNGISKKVFT